jgi:myo-inositol-1(or 4)-monophosphatase
MTPQDTILALAHHVKAAVFPHLGTWRARKITGTASSGDATFNIDDIAEHSLEEFLTSHGVNVAYYSEDRGLVQPVQGGTPDGVLIVDPIDGTRAAIAGLESCVVSVAWADYSEAPTIADVRHAAILEIKGQTAFTASRGEGVRIISGTGEQIQPSPMPTTDIEAMAWTAGAVGAPIGPLFQAIGDIASRSTVAGGFFILNSSAFELTRLVSGQLAGIIDVRNRLLRDVPQTRDAFLRHGKGRLISLFGYDIAAAALIATEAGCVLTDAWGRSLDDWNLLDTEEANFGSLIAACNPTLHARIVEAVDQGFAGMRG